VQFQGGLFAQQCFALSTVESFTACFKHSLDKRRKLGHELDEESVLSWYRSRRGWPTPVNVDDRSQSATLETPQPQQSLVPDSNSNQDENMVRVATIEDLAPVSKKRRRLSRPAAPACIGARRKTRDCTLPMSKSNPNPKSKARTTLAIPKLANATASDIDNDSNYECLDLEPGEIALLIDHYPELRARHRALQQGGKMRRKEKRMSKPKEWRWWDDTMLLACAKAQQNGRAGVGSGSQSVRSPQVPKGPFLKRNLKHQSKEAYGG
jgi:hypothetical protein